MNPLIRFGADNRRFAEAAQYPDFFLARVTSQSRDFYTIITENGESLAQVSGNYRHQAHGASDYPAVGDFVMASGISGNDSHLLIHQLLERRSSFQRMAAGTAEQVQVIAANMDIVFVTMSLDSMYHLSRLERFLSVAKSSGALAVILLTKSDLAEDIPQVISDMKRVAPGTDFHLVSNRDPASFQRLFSYLSPGKTASFIGLSGAGKSTLINLLAGEERMATCPVRRDGKGRHTTTRRELLKLPQGGLVIDTPGIRELGVFGACLDDAFGDIDDLAASCKFADCSHNGEPGCAVAAALKDGRLDPRRLANYLKLKREARYEGLTFKEIETRKLNAMFEEIGGMKKARRFQGQNKKWKNK